MQNKMENHPVVLLFRWNHRYSIINLNFNEKQSKTTPFYFTNIYCFLFLLSSYLVPDLWVMAMKNVLQGTSTEHGRQLCFLGYSIWKFVKDTTEKELEAKMMFTVVLSLCKINKTDIVSGRAYFWVLAEIISCLVISSRFTIFKAEFCHPAGNLNSIRQI